MGRQDWETETLIPTNGGGFDVAHSLRGDGFDASEDGTGQGTPLVACESGQGFWREGAGPLRAEGENRPSRPGHVVAVPVAIRTANTSANGHGIAEGVAETVQAANQGAVLAPSLTAYNMDSRSPQSEEQQRIVGAVYKTSMQVRRLTPRECERLQGFPDDYTLIQHRNKPAADGPRYKALGNSMAVPVMAWIGRRIAMVEQLKGDSPHD